MSNLVMLDNVEHFDLRVKTERGEMFGDNINQVLVFPNEFKDLQREYAIFFRQDKDGEYQAVVLLGLDHNENLFLNGNQWNARYVPAVQARGPFSIGVTQAGGNSPEAGEPMIRIDMDNPAVNKEEGYPLFKPHGGYSLYLEQTIVTLQKVHIGIEYSKAFFAALQELDLIEPVAAEIKISDTKQYSIPGVFSISEERFLELPEGDLAKLHRAGFLALCYWVLSSLDNVNMLVERKAGLGAA